MNKRMSWIMGLSAVGLAIVGWIFPRRRKTPMRRMKNWTNESVDWIKSSRIPKMVMKTGRRSIKGLMR